jgi:hypothetical protein
LQQPWPVFWSHHPNANLVSTSLALANGKTLCLESVYGDRRAQIDPAWRAFRRPRPVHLPGNWTSIVSLWLQTKSRPDWTHWLLDALPRLAVLDEFRFQICRTDAQQRIQPDIRVLRGILQSLGHPV